MRVPVVRIAARRATYQAAWPVDDPLLLLCAAAKPPPSRVELAARDRFELLRRLVDDRALLVALFVRFPPRGLGFRAFAFAAPCLAPLTLTVRFAACLTAGLMTAPWCCGTNVRGGSTGLCNRRGAEREGAEQRRRALARMVHASSRRANLGRGRRTGTTRSHRAKLACTCRSSGICNSGSESGPSPEVQSEEAERGSCDARKRTTVRAGVPA